ncbi:MAG: sulfatase activating formylglycine-generating enzyme [Halioglobus sp.]|jgi:formylglycine-generating enzyme required for sulfatase activity
MRASILVLFSALFLSLHVPAQTVIPGTTFRDCDTCPEMVVIPVGSSILGSEPWEQGRMSAEGPSREVTIGYALAVSKFETTRVQFAEFIADTGYQPVNNSQCFSWNYSRYLGFVPWHTWERPGIYQEPNHPVICVSWRDASAFADWLSGKTGRRYRLPSTAESEYATRAGTRGPWFWGTNSFDACTYANVADDSFRRVYHFAAPFDCDDSYQNTAPVGTFKPNPWGLHDMLGNVYEWTSDCFHPEMIDLPRDGRAWTEGRGVDCSMRTLRSGSWVTGTSQVRASAQYFFADDYHSQIAGFRLVTELQD